MKHILEKTIAEATSQELLFVLIHINGVAEGPRQISYVEPVLETLVPIGPDTTARVLIFKDDMETLKDSCENSLTELEWVLFGEGTTKTLNELQAIYRKYQKRK